MLIRIQTRIRQPTFTDPLFHSTKPNNYNTTCSLNPQNQNPTKMATTTTTTQSNKKRLTCPKCTRPTNLCLCSQIQIVENNVHVSILQHSLEQKHPLNSARIAKLGLRNAEVCTVCDVNCGARFVIRVIRPGGEFGSGRKRKFDDKGLNFMRVLGSVRDGFVDLETGAGVIDGEGVLSSELGDTPGLGRTRNRKVDDKDSSFMQNSDLVHGNGLLGREEEVLIASIEKYGVVSDLHSEWNLPIESEKGINFDRVLSSQEAIDALANGFLVKKLQKRGCEECEEFELAVPRGSVLLFPSDKAVEINDLRSMNIEVKNLIVLDGTWAKARRMYEENPWLRLLPHLKLNINKLSLFSGVRRQPKECYLSTIESVVYVLKALGEDVDGLDNLLDVFESLVVHQRRCKIERPGKDEKS